MRSRSKSNNRRRQGEEETMACPSFRSLSATAQDPSLLPSSATGGGVDGDDRRSNSDFEFSPHLSENSPADRRSYPVFGEEKILKAVGSSESESGDDDLDGVLPGTPCVWMTGAKVFNKCRSMGSGLSRRWRFRDLVVGRSRSDGKEKFSLWRVHIAPARKTPVVEEEEEKKKKKRKDRKEGDRRRTSFLPYRTDLVALFPPGRRSSRPFFF